MSKLDQIAEGSLSATQARAAIAELPRDVDQVTARRIYVSFRSWTWKAIDQKRRDPELREWFDLLKRAQVRLRPYEAVAAQMQVLMDLISESVSVAGRRPVSDVLGRRNARTLLAQLNAAPDGTLSKKAVMQSLVLKQANASRLMNVMLSAGLVERVMDGREAIFRLSRTGMDHARRIRSEEQTRMADQAASLRRVVEALSPGPAMNTDYLDLIGTRLAIVGRLTEGPLAKGEKHLQFLHKKSLANMPKSNGIDFIGSWNRRSSKTPVRAGPTDVKDFANV